MNPLQLAALLIQVRGWIMIFDGLAKLVAFLAIVLLVAFGWKVAAVGFVAGLVLLAWGTAKLAQPPAPPSQFDPYPAKLPRPWED